MDATAKFFNIIFPNNTAKQNHIKLITEPLTLRQHEEILNDRVNCLMPILFEIITILGKRIPWGKFVTGIGSQILRLAAVRCVGCLEIAKTGTEESQNCEVTVK